MPFMHLKSDVGYIFATAILYERDATSYYNSLHYNEVRGQINSEDAFFWKFNFQSCFTHIVSEEL